MERLVFMEAFCYMEGKDGTISVLYGMVGSMEGWNGSFGFSRHGACGSGDA